MSDSTITMPSGETLFLPAILDIKAASGLASSVMALQGSQLVLEGSGVVKVGAQCLQVLVSATKVWDRDGHSLTLANPSNELKQALAVAGVNLDTLSEEGANQ